MYCDSFLSCVLKFPYSTLFQNTLFANFRFPMFDLTKLAEQGDTLRERLVGNKHIRNAFVKQYCQLFQDYLDWKNQSLQIARKQIHFSFT